MNPSPNLFLIGPMGAGKSSLGRQLARQFGMAWLDLDACIEAHTGTDIRTIFDIEGEDGFRRRESELLEKVSTDQGLVLATGGGTVLAQANRELLRTRGFVVWLDVGIEQQLLRLQHDRRRPLLAAPDRRARLLELARERNPIYQDLADLTITSRDHSCRHAATRVTGLLERHWQRIPATAPART